MRQRKGNGKNLIGLLGNANEISEKQKDDELIATQILDQREFWKKIGSIGVANARQSLIPLQVETENGSITNDIPTVLQKLKNDFSNSFNPNENADLDDYQTTILQHTDNVQPMTYDPENNGLCTCDELKKSCQTRQM